jgi:RNA polymerase sigma factor (sigma-70 family)
MTDRSDIELLRDFARNGSQAAFAEIVRRHINLVYSVAFRYTGNSHEAQDVAQVVFIILAQKAARLREGTILPGWLYETTRFTAAKFLRTKVRRQFREQEAHMQSKLNEPDPDNIWRRLEPLLEEGMSQLGEAERTLIALRFYENKSGAEVAAALGVEEWAAHKRMARAVEKLRTFFARRGVSVSAGVLIMALTEHSVQAAPTGLASTIAAAAAMKGLGAGASTSTLLKTTLKIMAWTKVKTTVVAGVVILLAAGTTTVAVREIKTHYFPDRNGKSNDWRQSPYFNSQILDRAPAQVQILPAKYPSGGGYGSMNKKLMGLSQPADVIVQAAYGFWSTARTIMNTDIPGGKYDFISSLPKDSEKVLQEQVKEKFGLVAHVETREMDVLLLQVKTPNAPGLLPHTGSQWESGGTSGPGEFSARNQTIESVVGYLEGELGTPVLDRTGLKQKFDIKLKWRERNPMHPDPEILKQVIADELGLELVPARENIKVLVIEKAN